MWDVGRLYVRIWVISYSRGNKVETWVEDGYGEYFLNNKGKSIVMGKPKLILNVKMLGSFSMTSGRKAIVLGRGGATSKYLQLLQLLWLNSEDGVSKEQIVEAIFDTEKYSNLNNSVNNLIYQLKKQCTNAGLPDCNYVVLRNGKYYPDPEIEAHIDVNTFYELAALAESENNPKKRHELQMEAIDIYNGVLLPDISTRMWVITENLRLLDTFQVVVNEAAEYSKSNNEFDEMYSIYEKASRLYPDREWQVGMIDALMCKEEYTQAYKLYNQTVRYYSDEMGIPPSTRMLECYERMSSRIFNNEGNIEDIQGQFYMAQKETHNDEGAYNCSYPGFIDAYNVLSRNMERTGYSVYLMLCNVLDYKGQPIHNAAKLKNASHILNQAIHNALRSGDTYTKYSDSQFLILLVGTSQEDCDTIFRRLNNEVKRLSKKKFGIVYTVTSLAELRSA